jgi:hypothetical protein
MARKSGKKTSKAKRYPVQRFMYFDLPVKAVSSQHPEDTFYLDTAAALSAFNRRLYRQGKMYHVANVTFHDNQGDADIKISTLPDNWTTQAAHHAMFQAWKNQRARVLEGSTGPISGKWADFKVWMNNGMRTQTTGDLLVPITSDGQRILMTYGPNPNTLDPSLQEWNYSEVSFVDASGVDFDNKPLVMLGETANSTSVSLIDELRKSMAVVQDSSPDLQDIQDSVIFGMNPSILEEMATTLEEIKDDNDVPPYNAKFPIGAGNPTTNYDDPYPVRECGIVSTSSNTVTVGGFPLPLGLMQIEIKSSKDNTVGMCLELVPGRYKGVSAEDF